ncbi:Pre-mRNA-splicing factor ATP-dependent RNA helicase dhx15 [Cladochytrium tenue]|nr:Pre-mRNA-splicing factor ATP-dependent RNA helicase dhx15 [Cladochytrium tenue]
MYRTAPGKVFRLYSRDAFETLETDTTPEIQRSSLLGTTLALKRIGIDNVLDFEFIDPPERALFATAIKQLYYLGALDENGALTELGEGMSLFPTSPFVARAVLAACDAAVVGTNCGEELLTLAAMLSSEDPFVTPRAEVRHAEAVARHARFGIGPDLPSDTEEAEHDSGEGDAIRRRRRRRRRRAPPSGDHVALIRVFDAYVTSGEDPQWCRRNYLRLRSLRAARSIRDQLVELVRGRLGLPLGSCRRSNSGRPGRYHRGGGSSRVDGRQRAARRSSDNGDSRYRGDGDNDDDEVELADYDPAPILRAVCAGFFVNCARRHPARSFYYHYLASSALAAAPAQRRPPTSASGTATEVSPAAVAGSSTSSSSTPDPDAAAAALANPLLSLYIHPSSCLAPSPAVLAPGAAVAAAAAPSHAPSALTDLPNWVVYQDLHFVTRPNMRVVSRIDPAWARTGLDRVAACQLARLLAGCSSAAAADTASATAAAADADADAADAAVSGGAAADGADGGAAAAAASGRGKRPNVDPAAEESGGATRRRIEGGDEASGDAAAEAAAAARAAKADAARARFLARSAATRRGR